MIIAADVLLSIYLCTCKPFWKAGAYLWVVVLCWGESIKSASSYSETSAHKYFQNYIALWIHIERSQAFVPIAKDWEELFTVLVEIIRCSLFIISEHVPFWYSQCPTPLNVKKGNFFLCNKWRHVDLDNVIGISDSLRAGGSEDRIPVRARNSTPVQNGPDA